MNRFERRLGEDWAVILGWSAVGFVAIFLGIVFWGIPKYHYAHASASERCAIDVNKLHDTDKFCNYSNEIKSYKDVEQANKVTAGKAKEEARRAKLTPKQRCEEDNKSGPDRDVDGNVDGYFYITCHDDGTYDVKTDEDIQSEIEDGQSDNADCLPNYSGCVIDAGYDLDCSDIGHSVSVLGPDIYNLDADGDGIGCESY
jgi:hypothetical protein